MIKSVLYQPTMLKHSDILLCHIRTLLLQIPKRTIIITEDFRSESQKARDKLQNVLDISKHKALNVVESCKKLFDTPSSCISENYKICIKHKINKETVLKYPFLLCDSNLQKKLTVLQKIPIPLNSLIPLTQFTLIQLKFFMNFKETDVVHKINYLCDTFNMNAEEVCNNIASKPFIFTKSVSEIEALLKLLYGSGLTIEDILKDLWVLKNSENHVQKRLEFLKYHNVKNIKTWMIRCLEESLYKNWLQETLDFVVSFELQTQFLQEHSTTISTHKKKLRSIINR
ncbi:transcription termination factor, mitochondrial isoform X2 [Anthonomus grandis grandis]|uniref:transcription termination factor, mitochondrial isoform X2 n=1 Tax=Anthonomus grandis grandis TaxID=2921223 RepID=UPI002166013D|nr:transcription termination factor, mitochondrial isoform X2 [Anthonomus grandis grandis]